MTMVEGGAETPAPSKLTKAQGVMMGAVLEGRVKTRRCVDWWLDGEQVVRSHGRTLRELHGARLIAEGDGEGDGVLAVVVPTERGRARLSA